MCLCADNQEEVLGKYPHQSIRQAWTGAAAQAIRKLFDQHHLAEGCSKCAAMLNVGDYASVPIITFDQFLPAKRIPAFFSSKEHILSPKIFVMGDEGRSASERDSSPFDKDFQLQLREWLPELKVLKLETENALQMPLYRAICEDVLSIQPKIKVHLRTSELIPHEEDLSLLSSLKVDWKVSADRYFILSPATNQWMLDEKNLKESLTTLRRVVQNKHLNCQLDMAISVSNFHLIGDVLNLCVRENLGFQWNIREEDESSLMQFPRETLKATFQQLENTLKTVRSNIKLSAVQVQAFEALIKLFKYWWGETFRTKRFSEPSVVHQTHSVKHIQGQLSSLHADNLELLISILTKDANSGDAAAQQILSVLQVANDVQSLSDWLTKLGHQAFNTRFLEILALFHESASEQEKKVFRLKLKKIDETFNTDLLAEKLTQLFTSTPISTQAYHIRRLKEDKLLETMKESLP